MTAKQIFSKVLTYDEHANGGEGQDDPVWKWLKADASRWRVPRVTEVRSEGQGSLVALFIGEEGSGKTTQLDADMGRFLPADSLVVRLDFTNAAALLAAEDDRIEPALGRYVQNQVEAAVTSGGSWELYRRGYRRQVVLRKASNHLTSVKDKYAAEIANNELCDDTLQNDATVQEAVDNYVKGLTLHEQGIHALEAVQELVGRRAVFVVDNVDHLREKKVDKIFSTISGSMRSDTIALIAARTEHERLTGIFRHRRRVVKTRLDNDGAVYDILKTRVDSAESYTKIFHPQWADEAELLATQLVHAKDTVWSDPKSRRVVQDWQNGNVRHILSFFSELAPNLNHRDTSVRSTRGLVYAEMVRKGSDPKLLEIFSPQHVACSLHNLPFVYLKLRLLAYLRRTGAKPVAISKIHDDFSAHFGIAPTVVDSALDTLGSISEVSGAFLRRTSDFSAFKFGDGGDVVLLPAGTCFIDEIVYGVDYLSWLHDASPKLHFDPNTGLRISEIKLEKALVAVDRLLLPRFFDEHPYLSKNRALSDDERERLSSYLELFDYGSGKWFVLRLRDELSEYAASRGISAPSIARVNGRLTAVIDRLDELTA